MAGCNRHDCHGGGADRPRDNVVPLFPGIRVQVGEGCATEMVRRELPPDVSVSAIAEFGALIGDPARIAILVAMLGDEMLAAGQLAERAGVTAQTASGHLGKLVRSGLVAVRVDGRRRLHGLATREARDIVRQLYVGGSLLSRRGARRSEEGLVSARVCNGHLAGDLAERLANCLLTRRNGRLPELAPHAKQLLAAWGLGSPSSELAVSDFCHDWSAHCLHIGGPLGRSLLSRALALGWLRPQAGTSALVVTPNGVHGFSRRFGLSLS